MTAEERADRASETAMQEAATLLMRGGDISEIAVAHRRAMIDAIRSAMEDARAGALEEAAILVGDAPCPHQDPGGCIGLATIADRIRRLATPDAPTGRDG